jgi:hypothetical protein
MAVVTATQRSMDYNSAIGELERLYYEVFGRSHSDDGMYLSPSEMHERESYVRRMHEMDKRAADRMKEKQLEMQMQMQMMQQQIKVQPPQHPVPKFDPNKREAFNIPLETLEDSWRVKYGDSWVYSAVPATGDYWDDAYTRLNANGRFEVVEGWVKMKG